MEGKKKTLKVLKYDKAKASIYFALFKFLEIMAVLLFITGPYYLGKFSITSGLFYKLPQIIQNDLTFPLTYMHLWHFGMYLIVLLFAIGLIIYGITYICYFILKGVYWLFKAWVKGNWRRSTRHAENPTAKLERLSEQAKLDLIRKIDKQHQDRKTRGYCIGDEAEYINKEGYNEIRIGQRCKILGINFVGEIRPLWKDGTKGGKSTGYVLASSFKFFKKPIPKKPKLSKLRQKEISEKKK